MTTNQTQAEEQNTQAAEAVLTANLEAWVTRLPPREQELLAQAICQAAAARDDVRGHGGARAGVDMRSPGLSAMLSAFSPSDGVRPASTLDPTPFGSKPGIVVGSVGITGSKPSIVVGNN